LGLLTNALQGREDEAFVAAGNGLTDLVKRPTSTATGLRAEELVDGSAVLRTKIDEWRPGLILFAYRPPADYLLGRSGVMPGRCGDFVGICTFLLTSPYAKAEDSSRVDRELRAVLSASSDFGSHHESPARSIKRAAMKPERVESARTQRITAADFAKGQIRFPRDAKQFFPREPSMVRVMLRGNVVDGRYKPRFGPDRERSAILSVGKGALRSVTEDEVLLVARNGSGMVCLD
jgi:hypothetical protein